MVHNPSAQTCTMHIRTYDKLLELAAGSTLVALASSRAGWHFYLSVSLACMHACINEFPMCIYSTLCCPPAATAIRCYRYICCYNCYLYIQSHHIHGSIVPCIVQPLSRLCRPTCSCTLACWHMSVDARLSSRTVACMLVWQHLIRVAQIIQERSRLYASTIHTLVLIQLCMHGSSSCDAGNQAGSNA